MTFLRLSVPDLAAQISTALAEMGRPLSCHQRQRHNACQGHEEFQSSPFQIPDLNLSGS